MNSSLMKPLAAGLAIPGLYIMYKFHEYREKERKRERRRFTDKDLQTLNRKIQQLLKKLEKYEVTEPISSKDEECVVCMSSPASICTKPCGHQVICRRCFVKTIQMAVSQRLLPLRCVVCRAKVTQLQQTTFATHTSS
ncbi:mitochondrial E3 ubiquitin protein ligase 1-like [Asterias rubens]|uniref:mitochondrial E3 ubiquitin protein ligase 1-like n=1 Tax=Asterias rubens TaxID=7604 RepID=UPI00145578C9|nr:mitochondrial E3 ubiquitin protein ligase 1-like [Asterias rubens]